MVSFDALDTCIEPLPNCCNYFAYGLKIKKTAVFRGPLLLQIQIIEIAVSLG